MTTHDCTRATLPAGIYILLSNAPFFFFTMSVQFKLSVIHLPFCCTSCTVHEYKEACMQTWFQTLWRKYLSQLSNGILTSSIQSKPLLYHVPGKFMLFVLTWRLFLDALSCIALLVDVLLLANSC